MPAAPFAVGGCWAFPSGFSAWARQDWRTGFLSGFGAVPIAALGIVILHLRDRRPDVRQKCLRLTTAARLKSRVRHVLCSYASLFHGFPVPLAGHLWRASPGLRDRHPDVRWVAGQLRAAAFVQRAWITERGIYAFAGLPHDFGSLLSVGQPGLGPHPPSPRTRPIASLPQLRWF